MDILKKWFTSPSTAATHSLFMYFIVNLYKQDTKKRRINSVNVNVMHN